jgi:hypothetical protein
MADRWRRTGEATVATGDWLVGQSARWPSLSPPRVQLARDPRTQEHHNAPVIAGVLDVQVGLGDIAVFARDIVPQREPDPVLGNPCPEPAGAIRNDRWVLVATEQSFGRLIAKLSFGRLEVRAEPAPLSMSTMGADNDSMAASRCIVIPP